MISVQLGSGSVIGFLLGLGLVWWLEPVTRSGAIAALVCMALLGAVVARVLRWIFPGRKDGGPAP